MQTCVITRNCSILYCLFNFYFIIFMCLQYFFTKNAICVVGVDKRSLVMLFCIVIIVHYVIGILQVMIGALTLFFGIGATAGFSAQFWLTQIGSGIWGGIWIKVTGIVTMLFSRSPNHSILNVTSLAFCIISTILAFLDGIFFAIGLR